MKCVVLSKIKGLAVVAAFLATAFPIHAEVVPEVTLSGGYTDNLFNDSSSYDDSYTAVSPLFKFYPSAETEISLRGTYTAYHENTGLSNFYAGAGITIIPDMGGSRFGVMLSANGRLRFYGDSYEVYDNQGVDLEASLSYKVSKQALFRAGISAATTGYSNSESGGSDGVGVLAGLNLTPYGSNSLNLEGGLSLQRYVTGLDTVLIGSRRRPSSSVDGQKSDFHIAYYSARYSRPLGNRTGVNAFFTGKKFVQEADSIIYGFSIDYLSPWYSLWDGWTGGVNIKNYPGGDFIIETGITYSDKQFIENLEVTTVADTLVYTAQNREDERVSAYVRIQRPFKTKSGMLIRPSIKVRFIDNSSNMALFRYDYLDFQAGLTFKF